VNHTPVYAREVVKRALELHATAVILVHSHPSGDPTPSRADRERRTAAHGTHRSVAAFTMSACRVVEQAFSPLLPWLAALPDNSGGAAFLRHPMGMHRLGVLRRSLTHACRGPRGGLLGTQSFAQAHKADASA
jgi:hypothetical protein